MEQEIEKETYMFRVILLFWLIMSSSSVSVLAKANDTGGNGKVAGDTGGNGMMDEGTGHGGN